MKFIIPKEETFGVLEFAGEGETIIEFINGKRTPTYRVYNLYSSVQKADNVEVRLPYALKAKSFGYEERVQLINPRLEVESNRVGERSYVRYILYADDLIVFGSQVEK
ncbi:DUF961 family protein [Scatolibacter rhodanostii]|uniref:DUF961 family protein n=1 Tax=Scatolibacter rhodanostii TaxID=2014781 RepID=UPI000C08B4FA|nr:DUF961 family protein [Scatolibacter rhodanostii]